jgi:hypothetical protein
MSTSSAASAGAASGSATDGVYVIRSLFDGCVMAVRGGSVEPGTPVVTADAAVPPDAGQTWRFVAVEPGWWFIRSELDAGLVMSFDPDLPANPPVVMDEPRIDERDSQLWSLVPTATLGYWYIQSKLGATVMDIDAFAPGPDVQIIGFTRKYGGYENQAWGFAPVA